MGVVALLRGWDSLDVKVKKVANKLENTARACWHLGFTSFGGPPVHFKIFYDRFLTKLGWIDDQVYQELFSVTQACSGPASTKMLYCINLMHDGFLPAIFGFLLWSLPGAIVMYGLSIGVSNIGDSLPRPVYALLSGLNAATVGIIALAAVQLSEKAITDKLTRILVFFGGAAAMLYNGLWYFPALMAVSGVCSVVYDFRWLHPPVKAVARFVRSPFNKKKTSPREEEPPVESIEVQERSTATAGPSTGVETASSHRSKTDGPSLPTTENEARSLTPPASPEPRIIPEGRRLNFNWKFGLSVILAFLASFVIVMTVRGVVSDKPPLFDVFANFYLAGTIIFGGGPVVIPLLREYVVSEGWVRPRDFLIGVAIIQSLPGPNFNVAVYLGSLAALHLGYPSIVGAVVGYLGLFAPGLIIVHGTMGIWSSIRGLRGVKSAIRGVNAAAVGLMYTAVYRLWQIGYIDEPFQEGTSLANDPWWVVVTATSYVGGYWFNLNPPMAIVLGAVMGMIRYGVVSA
ncbi:related to chromate transport protein [Cephalotrichum gorgonifer]|uniref:Related to chromate transport protein n=1 Tax=Cephalotrichum gorgonifer TaxID=2041049 RepID=A0AAE8MYX7_9PEZI|nr:related to chromate transport protein [Cephalotrichum gorgonifer]